MSQLRGEGLAEAVVEDVVAGGVGEIGEDDGVFFGERGSAMEIKVAANYQHDAENRRRSNDDGFVGEGLYALPPFGPCGVILDDSRDFSRRRSSSRSRYT